MVKTQPKLRPKNKARINHRACDMVKDQIKNLTGNAWVFCTRKIKKIMNIINSKNSLTVI